MEKKRYARMFAGAALLATGISFVGAVGFYAYEYAQTENLGLAASQPDPLMVLVEETLGIPAQSIHECTLIDNYVLGCPSDYSPVDAVQMGVSPGGKFCSGYSSTLTFNRAGFPETLHRPATWRCR